MGVILSTPVELIRVQRTGNQSYRCAVAEMQGWRLHHEDAHAMKCDGSWGNFWVLDGHGGDSAANFCAPLLAEEVGRMQEDNKLPSDEAIQAGFVKVDASFRAACVQDGEKESGSTVIGAVASRAEDGTYTLKLMNCGDSRGLLIRDPNEEESDVKEFPMRVPSHAEGQATAWPVITESVDHKPDHPVERARIEKAGGFVSSDTPARLDGNLAVSRGLGDFEYKSKAGKPPGEQKVSCIPDIYEVSGITAGSLCILACDGLWDVMTAQVAAAFVRDWLKRDPSADLGEICSKLVQKSLELESKDNVTVMIVHFTDGTYFSRQSNRFNNSDEMLNFESLLDQGLRFNLDEDTSKQYKKFLRRCKFPMTPVPCSVSGRWYLSMFKCPGSGKIYCNRSCQKKGWKAHKKALLAGEKGDAEKDKEEAAVQ